MWLKYLFGTIESVPKLILVNIFLFFMVLNSVEKCV